MKNTDPLPDLTHHYKTIFGPVRIDCSLKMEMRYSRILSDNTSLDTSSCMAGFHTGPLYQSISNVSSRSVLSEDLSWWELKLRDMTHIWVLRVSKCADLFTICQNKVCGLHQDAFQTTFHYIFVKYVCKIAIFYCDDHSKNDFNQSRQQLTEPCSRQHILCAIKILQD